MPVAIVGVNGAMAPGTVITSQNPVDGETLDAASNNTAMQTLSNYIKSLAEKYMDLATLQTATAAKAFAAGVFAGGGTLGVGLAAYLDGRGTGSAPGVSGAADDNVAGVGVRGWGGLITANVNALALALYRGANLATPDNTYVGVVGRIWGALAWGTSGTSAPSPAGTVALRNTLTPHLLTKGRGYIDGSVPSLSSSQNISGVTATATYVEVTLAQAMADTFYGVSCRFQDDANTGNALFCVPRVISTTVFRIYTYDATGAVVDPATLFLTFEVFGEN